MQYCNYMIVRFFCFINAIPFIYIENGVVEHLLLSVLFPFHELYNILSLHTSNETRHFAVNLAWELLNDCPKHVLGNFAFCSVFGVLGLLREKYSSNFMKSKAFYACNNNKLTQAVIVSKAFRKYTNKSFILTFFKLCVISKAILV